MAKDHLDAEAVRAAQWVLDAFMKAFNARDIPAFEETFNFPSVRLASQALSARTACEPIGASRSRFPLPRMRTMPEEKSRSPSVRPTSSLTRMPAE